MTDDTDAGEVEEGEDGGERRIAPRHLACFPTYLHMGEPAHKKRVALIRDLSVSGALLLAEHPLPIGERLSLSLYLSLSAETERSVSVAGRIVRSGRREPKQADLWRYSLAVRFDHPLTELEADIRALAERQATLGLVPR